MNNKVGFLGVALISSGLIFADFWHAQTNLSEYVNRLSSKSRYERVQAYEKLFDSRDEAIPVLLASLGSYDDNQRLAAIKMLYELKAREAVPDLIRLLRDGNRKIRITSAYALGRIGDSRASDDLISFLISAGDGVSERAAIVGLGLLGDSAARPYLTEKLKSDDEMIRITTAGALGRLRSVQGFEEAMKGTYSEDTRIAKEAMYSLGLIGDIRAEQRLNEMLGNPDAKWKNYAELALEKIKVANLPVNRRIEILGTLAFDKNRMIAEWAIDTLAGIGTDRALQLLEVRSEGPKDKIGYRASRKLEATGW